MIEDRYDTVLHSNMLKSLEELAQLVASHKLLEALTMIEEMRKIVSDTLIEGLR